MERKEKRKNPIPRAFYLFFSLITLHILYNCRRYHLAQNFPMIGKRWKKLRWVQGCNIVCLVLGLHISVYHSLYFVPHRTGHSRPFSRANLLGIHTLMSSTRNSFVTFGGHRVIRHRVQPASLRIGHLLKIDWDERHLCGGIYCR